MYTFSSPTELSHSAQYCTYIERIASLHLKFSRMEIVRYIIYSCVYMRLCLRSLNLNYRRFLIRDSEHFFGTLIYRSVYVESTHIGYGGKSAR